MPFSNTVSHFVLLRGLFTHSLANGTDGTYYLGISKYNMTNGCFDVTCAEEALEWISGIKYESFGSRTTFDIEDIDQDCYRMNFYKDSSKSETLKDADCGRVYAPMCQKRCTGDVKNCTTFDIHYKYNFFSALLVAEAQMVYRYLEAR